MGTRTEPWKDEVTPALREHLVSYYDFEHPFPVDEHDSIEVDQGSSETLFNLVNGLKEMRVRDGAFPGSNNSIQTQQVNPTVAGNDDWKAGVWNANGVPDAGGVPRRRAGDGDGLVQDDRHRTRTPTRTPRTRPTATTPSDWPGSCRATPTGTGCGRCWS